MKIRIHGQNKNVTRKETRYATVWMLRQLMPKKVWSRLKIHMFFRNEVRAGDDELAIATTVPASSAPILRSFIVEMDNSLSRERQLRTLAHELVHVKQYALGEMRDIMRNYKLEFVRFNDDMIDVNRIKYKNQPWEIEANRKEYGIYRRYLEHVRTKRVDFS